MNKIHFLTMVCVACLAGCKHAKDKWPAEGTFQGTHLTAFENSAFTPDGSDEVWWLSGNLQPLPYVPQGSSNKFGESYRVRVYGRLSPIGSYGHLGSYQRELVVERIIEYEVIKKQN
jgi:hypothetical protein